MIDKYGNSIFVGWEEHWLVWLRAANTLEREERVSALEQISQMTGRSFKACKVKMNRMIAIERQEARELFGKFAMSPKEVYRRLFIPATTIQGMRCLGPSGLSVVTEAAKMGGKASRVKSPIVSEAG